jgi:CheY-like chemotaxis protein
VTATASPARATAAASKPAESVDARSPSVDDDRNALEANARLILVIEDDAPFARILVDLIHERGFQCVVAGGADEGVRLATKLAPRAILLDVGLPDHSGLSALERLKRNAVTRHIPVHVMSVSDYSETALAMGAVGFALKPVRREEVVRALTELEARGSSRVRRLLIVEDDRPQRDAIAKLLGSAEVEIIGVGTVEEALSQLRSSTFDCVVTDLSLPDESGYALLEHMAEDDACSFPPVIVYTGRSLTREEEQKLRKYSSTIIVKGARSPERLLDEVTLFLHQVESSLSPDRQRMLRQVRDREAIFDGRRILVVEDDVRNIFAITSVLEPKGATIEIARNGREALTFLEKHRDIDLVLMDIMMPEMDGITCMVEIRKRAQWAKLPIIALTAKAMKHDQERCLEAGANDYISKPLHVETLLSLLRVWMPR